MATFILFLALINVIISEASLSYRSDGPNVEYKSLLRKLERTPYILHDGSWYRDMLTMEASKAVGQYARKYDFQPYQYYEKVRIAFKLLLRKRYFIIVFIANTPIP